MKRILIAALISAGCGAGFAQEPVGEGTATEFIGSVVFPQNTAGAWKFTTASWAPVQLAQNVIANCGGYVVDNLYYITRYEEVAGIEAVQTISYDLTDWSVDDNFTGDITYMATTMAYNPLRDEVLGCFYNEDRKSFRLATWQNFTPRTVIRQLERPWAGCTFGPDGTFYAIERTGDLYTVDTKTGDMTLVGSTGLATDYATDALFDENAGKIIFGYTDGTVAALYHIDPATAAATKLYDMPNGDQICGMAMPYVAPADGAPRRVSSISLSFSGTSKEGKISFSMPTTSHTGSALAKDQELTYTVKANGAQIATGTSLPGQRVNLEWTAPADDSYNIEVTTANAEGTSAICRTKKFLGNDTPKAPTSFVASVSGTTVTLQWGSASSTGVNGGNIPSSALTYTVVRNDGKVIAENVATRKATDELEIPEERTEFFYTLTASANGLTSEPKETSHFFLGTMTPPVEAAFTASTDVAGWTFENAEGCTNTWAFYSYDKALRLYGSGGFDSWAITQPVKLKGGFRYPVTATVKTSNYNDETIEVMFGAEANAASMTGTAIAAQTLKSSQPVVLEGEIITRADGTFYLGFHGTSNPSRELYLLGFSIGEGVNVSAPAKPADLTVTAPTDGTAEATIKFTLPSMTIGDKELTGDFAMTRYTISRDGNIIFEVTSGLEAGMAVEYTDKADDLTLGMHTYSVAVENAYGTSESASAEILVGPHRPVAPESVTMIEDANTGKVTLTWTPVTTDVDGNTIKPEAVTYRIMNRAMETVANDLTGTSFTIQAVEEGTQAFVQFGVYAKTTAGESEKFAATAYKPVGTPSVAPWSESFADKEVHSPWGYNYIKGNDPWMLVSEGGGATPQDNDGGFAYFEAYGVYTAFVTGKIDLSEIDNPALTYYTYNYNSTVRTNSIDVQVDCGDGNGFVSVQENVVSETGAPGTWNKVVVPLDAYAGGTICVRFEPKNADLAYYYLDNIRVAPYVEHNLTAVKLSAPAAADLGKEFEIEIVVSNTGEKAVKGFDIELWNGDDILATRKGSALEPAETKTYIFTYTPVAGDGEELTLRGTVDYSLDMAEGDNTTPDITIGIVAAVGPTINDLHYSSFNGNSLTLEWSAPDLTAGPAAPFTESFENATVWDSAVEGWKLLDQDKKVNGGIQINKFPLNNRATSWVVANPESDVFASMSPESMAAWAAHTGKQFLISSYVMLSGENVQSDDWAISPKLYGGAQAISFFAKSFDPNYLEDFEVLYSKDTTAPEDFVSLAKVTGVPNMWMQYRYKMPEGAKYLAIRSRSTNKFFLFLDDVSFIPAEGEAAQRTLKGYNIYRDGLRLNDALLTEPTFTESLSTSLGAVKYFVTPVFDNGEGRRSNELEFDPSGIDSAEASAISVVAGNACVFVRGLVGADIRVYSADGRLVASQPATGHNVIALNAGIYIVNAGNVTCKVAIR